MSISVFAGCHMWNIFSDFNYSGTVRYTWVFPFLLNLSDSYSYYSYIGWHNSSNLLDFYQLKLKKLNCESRTLTSVREWVSLFQYDYLAKQPPWEKCPDMEAKILENQRKVSQDKYCMSLKPRPWTSYVNIYRSHITKIQVLARHTKHKLRSVNSWLHG